MTASDGPATPELSVLPILNAANAPPGTPLRPYTIAFTAESIREYLARTGESPDGYLLDGRQCVPPVILLGCYLRLIHDSFFYETGVHSTSDLTIRRLPWQGEPLQVGGEVMEHFERNGNSYVRFSVRIATAEGVALASVDHVSIYRLRARRDRA